ncbi:5'/3'-nucleotidase SurE [Rickettsiales endosymbiont of Stachyamoeba lipophora]|uniref:5'/3'-nucleotidase SurE n=1 Tax=Rickettsiales endosymbiont of Stachyamoeba lipophora TaxID=2486578 RepID=UPI000F64B75E|nr:5'/3'-nucleotidase SurE [Rickettsiales endosymbiont of Stachyamoeba lipophora]AZL15384.1 5'/3'-nucleotidase SurE [Rickettsiales endosymbiont of Stachyamoeba lipophora]
MRILISNDDGINALGIKLLYDIARQFTSDVWVIAPLTEQSGASHTLSLRKPLKVTQVDNNHYAVDGTPTDAVLIGIREILKDKKPDLVLSGINAGCNLGEDVTYSGTVAAAMEAVLLNIPAIALSQKMNRLKKQVSFDVAKHYTQIIIEKILSYKLPEYSLINVNFPLCEVDEVQGVKVTSQGKRIKHDSVDKMILKDQDPYYWIGSKREYKDDMPESDLQAIIDNYISVTPLDLDLTNYKVIVDMKTKFSW